ncbi:hypothetical protein F2P56_010602 [Juglans regia]|uniref:Uncharacterized protein n=1 Tax=Juglans regia TaxID=51240 RepID=A0A833XT22_JUGRE|nr:hypothetical protein F2P56_010601 [Juglans regia]KAF5470056.1 hypothetical protein F2P56_010602 [Juglans regia]
MVRRKRVRQTSESEVGMFDILDISTPWRVFHSKLNKKQDSGFSSAVVLIPRGGRNSTPFMLGGIRGRKLSKLGTKRNKNIRKDSGEERIWEASGRNVLNL